MNEAKKIVNMNVNQGAISLEEQKRLFNMTMANVKSFSTGKSNRKNVGIVAVDTSSLFVDYKYQGLRTHSKIKKLINNWDERKLSPIIIVPHPEEYRFAVVDGQGRLIASKELGYDTLQAIVLLDAPNDPKERLKFEAELFIGQDDETESVKDLEKHLARVIIGDQAAVSLNKLFDRYNITFTDSKGCKSPGVLGSYTSTYKAIKNHGEKCLDYVFSIINKAGWDKETNGYATYVTESIKNIWVTFQSKNDRESIYTYLSKMFRKIDPLTFVSNAKTKYPVRKDSRKVCTLYLEDIIEKELGLIKTT